MSFKNKEVNSSMQIKKIPTDELYNRLVTKLANDNIDFLAFVMSPFHLLGVEAFLYKLKIKSGREPKGIIIVIPHPREGIFISPQHLRNFRFINSEVLVLEVTSTTNLQTYKRYQHYLKSLIQTSLGIIFPLLAFRNKNRLFIISALRIKWWILRLFSNIEILTKYVPTFVVVEEGIGTYMDRDVWSLVRKYEQFNTSLVSILLSSFVQKIIKLLYPTEFRFIFKKHNNRLTLNRDVVYFYKKIIKMHNLSSVISKRPLLKRPWALIATQPFVEYNQVHIHDYLLILDRIIEILENHGFNVAIKPHPRESFGKYKKLLKKHENLTILSKSFVLEDILQLSPNILLGFTSTALITSKLFYGIPSISMIDVLIQFSDDPLLTISAKQFKEKFHNVIWFIDSIEGLENMVEGLK